MIKTLKSRSPLDVVRAAACTRREMLGIAALSGLGVWLAACTGDPTDPTKHATIDLRTESGALNFAYALLQLETDFWMRVSANQYPGTTLAERSAFTSYVDETYGAREDLHATQTQERIVDAILFRFPQVVDFSDRTSTLTNARIITDNVALGLFTVVDAYLTTQAKLDQMAPYADAALARSTTVRGFLALPPLDPADTAPATIMTTLEPYFQTTFTVTSA